MLIKELWKYKLVGRVYYQTGKDGKRIFKGGTGGIAGCEDDDDNDNVRSDNAETDR